ncbi:MAG: hypothetical protein AAGA22_08355 [Pseudomonadota bacterium]
MYISTNQPVKKKVHALSVAVRLRGAAAVTDKPGKSGGKFFVRNVDQSVEFQQRWPYQQRSARV